MYPRKRELNIYNNIVLKPRQLYISPVFFLFSNFRMFLTYFFLKFLLFQTFYYLLNHYPNRSYYKNNLTPR